MNIFPIIGTYNQKYSKYLKLFKSLKIKEVFFLHTFSNITSSGSRLQYTDN